MKGSVRGWSVSTKIRPAGFGKAAAEFVDIGQAVEFGKHFKVSALIQPLSEPKDVEMLKNKPTEEAELEYIPVGDDLLKAITKEVYFFKF